MIYLASSWKNPWIDSVREICARNRLLTFDFRVDNPIQPMKDRTIGTFDDFRNVLREPETQLGYDIDHDAMCSAQGCILIMPCGRSAHMELGWFVGRAKPTCIFYPTHDKYDGPDLMYKMTTVLCGVGELETWLKQIFGDAGKAEKSPWT